MLFCVHLIAAKSPAEKATGLPVQDALTLSNAVVELVAEHVIDVSVPFLTITIVTTLGVPQLEVQVRAMDIVSMVQLKGSGEP